MVLVCIFIKCFFFSATFRNHQNLLYLVILLLKYSVFHYERQENYVAAYVQKWKKRSEMGCFVQCNSKEKISFEGIEEEFFGIN